VLACNIGAIVGWCLLWEILLEFLDYLIYKAYHYKSGFSTENIIFYAPVIIPIAATTYEIWFGRIKQRSRFTRSKDE
tara:strand:- start:3917 stop:4147 length:231 start_codon:yes stop_codon:yes gene_type:complete